MDYKNIEKKYRPIPFWSWNDKLDSIETKRQIKAMHDVGIGGFFMHARGGLQTPYLQDEWFENVTASLNTAKEFSMYPWAYDENGWPSGFANGKVNGLGVEYQQKYLRMENELIHIDTAICKCGDHYFYYDVNPFYVDVLDKQVATKFIEESYEPYFDRYGNQFEGFFTDEPQISREGFPWSFVFEEEYARRYQENICEHLEELFLPIKDYKKTRVKFWKMVTDLFSDSFMKTIYEVCKEKNVRLTGHLLLEESLISQLTTNGACMPHYEYFDIPGMDWLGRNIYDCLTPLQVSSVAQQLGKEQVISETFALCGHNVSFAELKGIYEWQMVHGINLLCQHLEGYSIRGIRKRDYPPAMYIQQPWWEDYSRFVDGMSRIGKILTKGKTKVDVLLIHPQTSAWALFDANENKGIDELNNHLLEIIKALEEKHIVFHLGDETIMERHAKVENSKLKIGEQMYSYVIDPGCEILLDSTQKIIEEFKSQGGKMVDVEEIPANPVIDNPRITYTIRYLEEETIHYFVNTSSNREIAKFNIKGKQLDIYTGEWSDFSGVHEFEPWGSLLIKEDSSCITAVEEDKHYIHLENIKYKILNNVTNALVLDKCDYYFDDVLQEKEGYVLNIGEKANQLNRKVHIKQEYRVSIKNIPATLFLVCETPEIFDISVNGLSIEKKIVDTFVDRSLKVIDIKKYVQNGDNIIRFECDFVQSDEVYNKLKRASLFETEKNNLVYDMEIEAVYLIGDFSIKTDGIWESLDKSALRYYGNFVIDSPQQYINLKHIEKQGFPFFCGKMILEGEINIGQKNSILQLDILGVNVVHIEINGITKTLLTNNQLPLNDFNVIGRTKIKITIINNLRNLMGPHHRKEGELYWVVPGSFYKEQCIWNEEDQNNWDENYCFVETSLL